MTAVDYLYSCRDENLFHRVDQFRLRHLLLRLGLPLQMRGAIGLAVELRQFRAEHEILDDHLRTGGIVQFIAALDDRAGRVALVGVFELLADVCFGLPR